MQTTFSLSDGTQIPCIGFGPGILGYSAKYTKLPKSKIGNFAYHAYRKFISRPLASVDYIDSISNALCQGFRLLDYSAAYGNMNYIGKAIRKSGVGRENIILTSRVSNRAQVEHEVREEFFQSLKQLQTDYIDILQFHWPVTDAYLNTWDEMVKLKNEGYVRILGVANCHRHHIESLIAHNGEKPLINQFEVHPLFSQKPLISYCKSEGIQVEAYTPIARYDDRLVRLPLLRQLEQKYHKNFVQVILRWHIQNGVIPVIRSLSKRHQVQNLDIFDFELSPEDMQRIDGINIDSRLRYNPDNCDFSIL